MKKFITITILLILLISISAGARTFNHPGALYSRADLDRMRALVSAQQQPYYSTFLALKNSGYSNYVERNRGTSIAEGKFNSTVGEDGRRAHDMAILWHITGDETYAKHVVKILNANSYYTNTSSRSTAPLDNGKIFLLLQYSLNDDENDVTFYWNIYNFDSDRFGNQGLFAARAMMAMAIFLDNEVMYDRALRYLLGFAHREDDLPYVPGPPTASKTPFPLNEEDPESGDGTTSYMLGYQKYGRGDFIEDYGYDEQLIYYIYPNGQNQEACRDQSTL